MYQELQDQVKGQVILQDDENYEGSRAIFNAAVKKRPAVIVVCEGEEDVAASVKFANKNNLEISVRGGGHHVSGTALTEGGVMIDMSHMKKVEVLNDQKVAFVDGGATLAEVDEETQKFGLATPVGTVSETGIAGLALSGGLGYLRSKYGLACDNIVGASVVTAEGEVVKANKNENEDLFWGIRGGGGNFGIVTQFEFQLHSVGPDVLALDVMYDMNDVEEIFSNLDEYVDDAPDEVSINLTMMELPPFPELPEFLHHKPVVIVSGMYAGPPEEGEKVIEPLRKMAEPIADNTGILSYVDLQKKLDPMVPQKANFKGTSLFFESLSAEDMQAVIEEKKKAPGHAMFQIRELHGKMNQISSNENAFAIRDAKYLILVDVMYEEEQEKECEEWVQHFYNRFSSISLNGTAYLNGIDPEETIIKNTFADNFDRLLKLKQKYDPQNIFHVNHNIKVSESHEYSK